MPHPGGFHGNVIIGQSGTTPGPAGMGSPPPKTHKEKVKDFFSMTPKERADRFNKNQKKYKKSFESRNPTTDEFGFPKNQNYSRYGASLDNIDDNRTEEQKSIDDRRLYRQYKSPQTVFKNKLSEHNANEKERLSGLGYFSRVKNVNNYFNNKAINAKKMYIQPNASWWERTLKSNAIDAWYSTGNIAVGTMEGALGLTLDPAASFIASTVANGNDLWRAINGLPFSPEIHNQIATDMQEHIIGATMAYWESTGYGAMRTATGKIPSMSATANFVSKKIPFEWNNATKVVNNMMKQKKNKASNMIIDGDFKIVTEAAIKNPQVKKEIKTLAIQSWEQSNMANLGSIQANAIANQMRVKEGIMPVQAQSLSAAATPKELITDSLNLKKEPFYNPIKMQLDSLPVNDAGQVKVKDIETVMSVKKMQRPMILSKFNDYLATLKENNVTNVDKTTVQKYINDNPITATIDVGMRDVPIELMEELSAAKQNILADYYELETHTNYVINNSLYTLKDLTAADVPGHNIVSHPLMMSLTEWDIMRRASGNRMIQDLTENYLKFVTGEGTMFNEGYTATEADLLKEFTDGQVLWKFAIPSNKKAKTQGNLPIEINRRMYFEAFKDKIMYALSHIKNRDLNAIPSDSFFQGRMNPNYYAKIEKEQSYTEIGKAWVSQLLDNFNNRKHFNKDRNDINDGFVDEPPRINGELISVDMLVNSQYRGLALEEIIQHMTLSDLPGWNSYITELMTGADTYGTTPNWQATIRNLNRNSTTLFEVNERVDTARQDSTLRQVLEGDKRPYVVTNPDPGNYETRGAVTYNSHPYSKYMEVKLTYNNLSGYPDFGDAHFKDTKNLASWSLVTARRINKGPLNPDGDKAYFIEEMQPSKPDTVVDEGTATGGRFEGNTFVPTTDGIPSASAIQGTPFYGTMTKMQKDADWYKKKLWADIRTAYDMGFDYIVIPTTKSIQQKTGSKGVYDTLPNVANKFGFDVIKNADMRDYGFGAPDRVIEQRLREAEDIQRGAEQVGDDFGPYGKDEIDFEFLIEKYGDHKFHIIDIRNKEKVFEILNKPQPVAFNTLINQTSEALFEATTTV